MYGYVFKRRMTNVGNPSMSERYQVARNLAAGLTLLCCNCAFLRAFGRPPNQDRELRFDYLSQGGIPLRGLMTIMLSMRLLFARSK